jgi:hypothetical protein
MKKLKDRPRIRLTSTGKVHVKWGQDSPDARFIEVVTACGVWSNAGHFEKVDGNEEVTCERCSQMLFKDEAVEAAKKNFGKIKPNLSLNLSKKAQEAVLHYTTNHANKADSINEIIVEMLEEYGGFLKDSHI